VLAGTYGNGLYRLAGGGWSHVEAGLTAPARRFIGPVPTRPGSLLAGTEPARVFRSDDGGLAWRELDGVTPIDGHELVPALLAARGRVRNLYSPPGRGRRLLASVEVAGLMRSEDGSESWTLAPVIEDEDVHLVTGHSADEGATWEPAGAGVEVPMEARVRRRSGTGRWSGLAKAGTRPTRVGRGPPRHGSRGPWICAVRSAAAVLRRSPRRTRPSSVPARGWRYRPR
jgi:hypothetical protein